MQTTSSLLSDIKREFFKYRNGIVAESLRKLYPDGKVIFGLNVPQLLELSKQFPKNLELGMALWNDNTSREARLFALYVLPPAEIEDNFAIKMFESLESTEEAEFLAFKILRNLKNPESLYLQLLDIKPSNPIHTYCLAMFKRNLEVR